MEDALALVLCTSRLTGRLTGYCPKAAEASPPVDYLQNGPGGFNFRTSTDVHACVTQATLKMKALLRKYLVEVVESEEIVDLPENYDGNPYGDTVPFCMASNWTLQVIDDEVDLPNDE